MLWTRGGRVIVTADVRYAEIVCAEICHQGCTDMTDRVSIILAGLVVGGLVIGALIFSTSCSLLLDLDQCEVDSDCFEFEECDEENLCRETQREYISSHIVTETTWTNDRVYVLEDMIHIVGAQLTIEPGTQIRAKPQAGLISRSGSRLHAEGTREEPIVFTSDEDPGRRLAGDWAGLALVGNAPVNRDDFLLRVDSDEHGRPLVGGSDDTWDCGTLRYVRVEFGGSEVAMEVNGQTELHKALNGITLAGCGSETTVEYVQSHLSDDDGIVAFGGSVDIRNAVVTRAQNDGFGFDTGWRGTAQYLAVQQDGGGEDAIEIQNLAEDHHGEPVSDGQIYNYTLIGNDRQQSEWQMGIFFKRGGKGKLSHGIIQGHPSAGLYVEGEVSGEHAHNGDLVVQNTLFYDIGADGDGWFDWIDIEKADEWDLVDGQETAAGYEGFLASDYSMFTDPQHNNVFGEDPGFDGDPYDRSDPGWVPAPEHTTGGEIEPPPESEGFDPTGNFLGAFAPNSTPWTDGWTSYPLH